MTAAMKYRSSQGARTVPMNLPVFGLTVMGLKESGCTASINMEDSPKAFKFFDHLPDLRVLVFDRPWNRECEFPKGNYRRCFDWESIRKIVGKS